MLLFSSMRYEILVDECRLCENGVRLYYAGNIESKRHLLVMILTLDVVDLPTDEMTLTFLLEGFYHVHMFDN